MEKGGEREGTGKDFVINFSVHWPIVSTWVIQLHSNKHTYTNHIHMHTCTNTHTNKWAIIWIPIDFDIIVMGGFIIGAKRIMYYDSMWIYNYLKIIRFKNLWKVHKQTKAISYILLMLSILCYKSITSYLILPFKKWKMVTFSSQWRITNFSLN